MATPTFAPTVAPERGTIASALWSYACGFVAMLIVSGLIAGRCGPRQSSAASLPEPRLSPGFAAAREVT